MAKAIPDAIIDLQLGVLEGDSVNVNSAEPTNYTEATSTFQLASQPITGANFTYAAGDVSGRKWTLTPATGTNIDNSGTATHVSITNLGDTTLRLVTTCTSTALTATNAVDINAFQHEIRDPA
jgi:hypothetical protein